jgi:hypothetical protein
MTSRSVDQLHCIDLPAEHPDGARACLTQVEWQAVFDQIAANESALGARRAMHYAQWFADNH